MEKGDVRLVLAGLGHSGRQRDTGGAHESERVGDDLFLQQRNPSDGIRVGIGEIHLHPRGIGLQGHALGKDEIPGIETRRAVGIVSHGHGRRQRLGRNGKDVADHLGLEQVLQLGSRQVDGPVGALGVAGRVVVDLDVPDHLHDAAGRHGRAVDVVEEHREGGGYVGAGDEFVDERFPSFVRGGRGAVGKEDEILVGLVGLGILHGHLGAMEAQ